MLVQTEHSLQFMYSQQIFSLNSLSSVITNFSGDYDRNISKIWFKTKGHSDTDFHHLDRLELVVSFQEWWQTRNQKERDSAASNVSAEGTKCCVSNMKTNESELQLGVVLPPLCVLPRSPGMLKFCSSSSLQPFPDCDLSVSISHPPSLSKPSLPHSSFSVSDGVQDCGVGHMGLHREQGGGKLLWDPLVLTLTAVSFPQCHTLMGQLGMLQTQQ